MPRRKRSGGMLRWLVVTALAAVVGATAYETLRRRTGWSGAI